MWLSLLSFIHVSLNVYVTRWFPWQMERSYDLKANNNEGLLFHMLINEREVMSVESRVLGDNVANTVKQSVNERNHRTLFR